VIDFKFLVISISVCPLILTLAEATFAQTVPALDSTTKKQDESPPKSTPSLTVTACANGKTDY